MHARLTAGRPTARPLGRVAARRECKGGGKPAAPRAPIARPAGAAGKDRPAPGGGRAMRGPPRAARRAAPAARVGPPRGAPPAPRIGRMRRPLRTGDRPARAAGGWGSTPAARAPRARPGRPPRRAPPTARAHAPPAPPAAPRAPRAVRAAAQEKKEIMMWEALREVGGGGAEGGEGGAPRARPPRDPLAPPAQAVDEEMERDPTVCLMGEDVGHYGGSYKVGRAGGGGKTGWAPRRPRGALGRPRAPAGALGRPPIDAWTASEAHRHRGAPGRAARAPRSTPLLSAAPGHVRPAQKVWRHAPARHPHLRERVHGHGHRGRDDGAEGGARGREEISGGR